MSWCDAVIFANKLSELEGLEPAYQLPSGFSMSMSDDQCRELDGRVFWRESANGYRLPTESEWEYAARAGSRDRYAGTNSDDPCDYANVGNPSAKEAFGWSTAFSCEDGAQVLAPVGSYRPNGWGLYDMTGNVWEWCWDLYGAYPTSASVDPVGAGSGSVRVGRGGSWLSGPSDVRVADRLRRRPSSARNNLGLRLARSN